MRRVRNKDTKPEMNIRRLVSRLGFRYRLHRKDLPGNPDLVFPGLRKVIFVHGCFWHGHEGCPASKRPQTNRTYWIPKLQRTKVRDQKNLDLLQELGWNVLTIWECEKDTPALTRKIINFLIPAPETDAPYKFYEFFAGGGMARIGLGNEWSCILANDNCDKKAKSYRQNHTCNDELKIKDVAELKLTELPGETHLCWASFPCQDLSEAGNGNGLNGERSGTFWPFWDLMVGMKDQHRKVPIVVLENVTGALSSNVGRDFEAIIQAAVDAEYRVGAMVIDGVHFVHQSRPRLFIIAVDRDAEIPRELISDAPNTFCHPKTVRSAYESLPDTLREQWLWWNLPAPDPIKHMLIEIFEKNPVDTTWHTNKQTQTLLNMMSPQNLEKVADAQAESRPILGTLYKRTRPDENGGRIQRAEVRFDQVAGCLRTPAGGSSRQTIIYVNGNDIRTRLLSPREAARLMGLDDEYVLPDRYNEAYHLVGDGLVVPVISWLGQHILTPLAHAINIQREG